MMSDPAGTSRIGHQRAHDLDEPPLAAAQVAGVVVRERLQAEPAEYRGRRRHCGRLVLAPLPVARQRAAERVAAIAGAADSRFSMTVSRLNSLASWNVRTRPSRARRKAGTP